MVSHDDHGLTVVMLHGQQVHDLEYEQDRNGLTRVKYEKEGKCLKYKPLQRYLDECIECRERNACVET